MLPNTLGNGASKRTSWLIGVGVLWLQSWGGLPVEAQILPPATFREATGPGNGGCTGLFGVQSGMDDNAPESVSFSASEGGSSFSGTATTLLAGPTASVTASGSQCSAAYAGSSASVQYDFTLAPAVPGAPMSGAIPVVITTQGSASVSGLGVLGNAQFILSGGIGVLFKVDVGDSPSLPLSDSFSETFTELVGVGDVRTVGLGTSCGVSEGTCSATVDPLIEIDPSALVDFNGVPTPATDLYALQFSEPVPEPSVWLSRGSALLVLAVLARRQRRR